MVAGEQRVQVQVLGVPGAGADITGSGQRGREDHPAGSARSPATLGFRQADGPRASSRVLPTVALASMAACASAARSSGNVWPISGVSLPAAAWARAAVVSSRICGGLAGAPRVTAMPRRAACSPGISVNNPLAMPQA